MRQLYKFAQSANKVNATQVTCFNFLISVSLKVALVDFYEIIQKKFLLCCLKHWVLWPQDRCFMFPCFHLGLMESKYSSSVK